MGMAASQARLLFITARLHDVELKAQQLLAAKIALGNQSDAAWEAYTNAMDETTLTVNSLNLENGRTSTVVASFATLTGVNGIFGPTGDRYALVRNGNLLLTSTEKKYYDDYIKNNSQQDPDSFAKYAIEMLNPSPKEDTDEYDEKYDYYYDLFLQIQSCDGKTEAIADENINNAEWLTNMVKCGQIQIYCYDAGERTDEVHFEFYSTSPSSDSGLKYSDTTEIDASAQKKAEAEYEHTMRQINIKEKKIDNELAKLETERNALTTMYDSVKKVIEDNVERTFGIFS